LFHIIPINITKVRLKLFFISISKRATKNNFKRVLIHFTGFYRLILTQKHFSLTIWNDEVKVNISFIFGDNEEKTYKAVF